MSAGNRDSHPRHPQQFAEHLGARDDGNFELARANHFGIGELDRGRDHDCVERPAQMIRMMAVADLDPKRRQPLSHGAAAEVASADRETQLAAQLGDPAHAGAADADKMQTARPGQHAGRSEFAHAASLASAISKQTRAMRAAPSGFAAA